MPQPIRKILIQKNLTAYVKILASVIMLLMVAGFVAPAFANEYESFNEFCDDEMDPNTTDKLGYWLCYEWNYKDVAELVFGLQTQMVSLQTTVASNDNQVDSFGAALATLAAKVEKLESYTVQDYTKKAELTGHDYNIFKYPNNVYFMDIMWTWTSYVPTDHVGLAFFTEDSTQIYGSFLTYPQKMEGPHTTHYRLQITDVEGEITAKAYNSYHEFLDSFTIPIDKSDHYEVIISQLDYNPIEGEKPWIKISNTGTLDVDLHDSIITTQTVLTGTHYDYPFPTSTILKAKESIIITLETADIWNAVKYVTFTAKQPYDLTYFANIAYGVPFDDPNPGSDHWEYDYDTQTWSFTGNQ